MYNSRVPCDWRTCVTCRNFIGERTRTFMGVEYNSSVSGLCVKTFASGVPAWPDMPGKPCWEQQWNNI